MSQGSDHAVRHAMKELGVGIERDDESHPTKLLAVTDVSDGILGVPRPVGGRVVAKEPPVELLQFAPFPLPAHPPLFAFAPDPRTIEEREAVTAVAFVQLRNARDGRLKKSFVLGGLSLRGIRKVRE